MWANVDSKKGRFHKAISAKTAEWVRIIHKQPDFALYDLLTMAIAIDNSIITEAVDKWATIETTGVHVRGQLVTDWHEKTDNLNNVKIVQKLDIEKAKNYYMAMVAE